MPQAHGDLKIIAWLYCRDGIFRVHAPSLQTFSIMRVGRCERLCLGYYGQWESTIGIPSTSHLVIRSCLSLPAKSQLNQMLSVISPWYHQEKTPHIPLRYSWRGEAHLHLSSPSGSKSLFHPIFLSLWLPRTPYGRLTTLPLPSSDASQVAKAPTPFRPFISPLSKS